MVRDSTSAASKPALHADAGAVGARRRSSGRSSHALAQIDDDLFCLSDSDDDNSRDHRRTNVGGSIGKSKYSTGKQSSNISSTGNNNNLHATDINNKYGGLSETRMRRKQVSRSLSDNFAASTTATDSSSDILPLRSTSTRSVAGGGDGGGGGSKGLDDSSDALMSEILGMSFDDD